jgi:hypothetical protein
VRRPVFIGDFCALVRRQRILDEDALAEGEKLDSNILSQHCEAFRVGSLRNRSEPGDEYFRGTGPILVAWHEIHSRGLFRLSGILRTQHQYIRNDFVV